jgi:DNA processing protein
LTTETEDLLWISAQQDRIIPRELVLFAYEKNKSLYDLFKMEEEDFVGIDPKALTNFLSQREKSDFVKYQDIYDLVQKNSINIIKYNEPWFPKGLRKLDDKGVPIMLYHQGTRIPFLNCIAIVGTRNCSTYGAEFANQISKELAGLGYVIVTGLARGIDAAAHRGAIKVAGRTIGVLPWMYKPYPPEHEVLMMETKRKGCLVSENFSQTSKFDRFKFLQRNAVISGISELLIAVESSFSGGTRWQVELAISQGKTVIAVEPEQSNNMAYDGYKRFLREGAIAARSSSEAVKIVEDEVDFIEPTDDEMTDQVLTTSGGTLTDYT